MNDYCIYFRRLANGLFVYLLLYVDNMSVAEKSMYEINKLKLQLSKESEIKDLGATKKILDMKVFRDK